VLAAEALIEPLCEARGLAAGYGGRPAIEGLDFAVPRGARVGVLGPNGGGKTTLFRALVGELRPLSGALSVPERCGVVPQTERSRLDYPVSALDVALMGTIGRLPWWRRPGREERRRALDALDEVGLREFAGESFGALSGGQRQRVLVARALMKDAPLVLLDEPLTGVDERSARRLNDLIGALASDGRAVMIATHDAEQVRDWELVLCLNRRQIAFGPPAETLTRETLEATYGGALMMLPGEGGAAIAPPHHHDGRS
jgi:ABC-type Mn2+/Zn2+ transport system ATPase subunit